MPECLFPCINHEEIKPVVLMLAGKPLCTDDVYCIIPEKGPKLNHHLQACALLRWLYSIRIWCDLLITRPGIIALPQSTPA